MDNKEVTLSFTLLLFNAFYLFFVYTIKSVTGNIIISLFLCLALLIFDLIVSTKKYKMIKPLGNFNFYRVVIFDTIMAVLPSVIVSLLIKQWDFNIYWVFSVILFYPMICTNKKIQNTSKEIDEKVKKYTGKNGWINKRGRIACANKLKELWHKDRKENTEDGSLY